METREQKSKTTKMVAFTQLIMLFTNTALIILQMFSESPVVFAIPLSLHVILQLINIIFTVRIWRIFHHTAKESNINQRYVASIKASNKIISPVIILSAFFKINYVIVHTSLHQAHGITFIVLLWFKQVYHLLFVIIPGLYIIRRTFLWDKIKPMFTRNNQVGTI